MDREKNPKATIYFSHLEEKVSVYMPLGDIFQLFMDITNSGNWNTRWHTNMSFNFSN